MDNSLRIRILGASHAPFVGVAIDGFPADFAINKEALHAFLQRRAPGQSALVTARKEADIPDFLSGITHDFVTDGKQILALIFNQDVNSAPYEQLQSIPRPGHADYPALIKWQGLADLRGGGQFSGRMTAPLCIAGGLCLQFLQSKGIAIRARIERLAGVDNPSAQEIEQLLAGAKAAEDSIGGIIEARVTGLPIGLGGPLFDGLESGIAAALFAIPGVKGVSFGDGFAASELRGSTHNDAYTLQNGQAVPATNHHGGILGGMSTGLPLIAHIAIKPTPSIALAQKSVNLCNLQPCTVSVAGRHDPCIVPRALPCVEAALAIALFQEVNA